MNCPWLAPQFSSHNFFWRWENSFHDLALGIGGWWRSDKVVVCPIAIFPQWHMHCVCILSFSSSDESTFDDMDKASMRIQLHRHWNVTLDNFIYPTHTPLTPTRFLPSLHNCPYKPPSRLHTRISSRHNGERMNMCKVVMPYTLPCHTVFYREVLEKIRRRLLGTRQTRSKLINLTPL